VLELRIGGWGVGFGFGLGWLIRGFGRWGCSEKGGGMGERV